MAGLLQEARDADSKAPTRYQVKLIISPFLRLQYLLDCLICTRNVIYIVLLLQLMPQGLGRCCFIFIQVGGGGRRGLVSSYFSSLILVVFCNFTFSVPLFSCLEHGNFCVCFFICSLFSFALLPLTGSSAFQLSDLLSQVFLAPCLEAGSLLEGKTHAF